MADTRSWWIVALVVGFRLTAISLAAEGDVRLIGSDRGIEGKLLIEHDAVWRTVCHDGWTHTDSDTVCKQLGFSKGAMVTRASTGEFTGVAGSPTVKSPGCTESNSRLSDCAGFIFQEGFSCGAEVDLSCYVDDFIGCYIGDPSPWSATEVLANGINSIERCISQCRDRGRGFAAMSGQRCLCGVQSATTDPLVSTVNCASPCVSDATEACGSSGGTSTYYTIWPTSVGQIGGSFSTANGCLYSRGFPGRYVTYNLPKNNFYLVTLPAAKYVALKIPVFDIYAMDRLAIGASRHLDVDLMSASDSPKDVLIPFNAPISGFTLGFATDASSPTEGNYGFVVCYESLDALPTTPPTTPPPTTLSTAPTTSAPTSLPSTGPPSTGPPSVLPTEASSTAPSSAGPVGTSPTHSSSSPMGGDSSSSDTMPTSASSSPRPTEKSSIPPTGAATTSTDPSRKCPIHHGATVEQRQDSDQKDVLLLNTGNPFTCAGFVDGIIFFSASAVPFKVSIWSVYDTNKYVLQHETVVTGGATPAVFLNALERSNWLPFLPGNVMGVSFQTSPLVWSEAATSNGEATQWVRWMLNDANPQHRDSANGTILNRAYSIRATLVDRKVCLVPVVPNSEPTDAIVASVYEMQVYKLNCKSKYRPAKSSGSYLCLASGSFDGDLVCEVIEGIFSFEFTFTQIIICVVVLVLLCLAVFVVACMMVCCRVSPKGKKDHLVESGEESVNNVDESDGNTLLPIEIDSENGELGNPVPVDSADSLPDSLPAYSASVTENDAAGPAGDAIDVPAADTAGTAVIDNPIAEVSARDGYRFGYPLADYDDLPNSPPPSTISVPPPPPPPPLPGTNPPFTSNDLPTTHFNQQPISPLGGSALSVPDSPDAGSDAALITNDFSDTLSNPSRGGRPTRRTSKGIAARLGAFQS